MYEKMDFVTLGTEKNVFCKTQFCVLLPHKNETTMKLAEALQERADLNTKISELRSRLYDNAVVQEGEKPAEDPSELLSELDKAAERL